MTKRISIAVVGQTVEVATVGFLGNDWNAYQNVCASMNLRWNRARGAGSKNVGAIENLPAIVNGMSTAGFTFDLDEATTAALKKATTSGFTDAESVAKEIIRDYEAELAGRGLKLWNPFQRDGAIFLAARDRALLGDEVGTGKTIQMLAALPENAAVVVCCPASVVVNWARECRRWRPDLRPVVMLKGASKRTVESLEADGIIVDVAPRWPANGFVFIQNWESIGCAADVMDKKGEELLVKKTLDGSPLSGTVLIGDEIHRVKSRTAKMTAKWGTLRDAVKEVGGKVIGASGTPIYNRPFDLANVLRALGLFNDVFVSWKDFLKRMGGYDGQYGIVWSGRVDPTVADSMKRVMIRREKETVLPWLPAKTYRDIEVEPSKALAKLADKIAGDAPDLLKAVEELGRLRDTVNSGDYDVDVEIEKLADLAERLFSRTSKIAFEDMSRMHAEMSKVGYAGAIDLIEDYEESGTPLVVACVHREQVELLGKRKGWATILGGDDLAKRAEVVRRFQAGEIDYIACTIKAGGVGITLNRASHLIMLSQDWSPSENEQMEGRVHRGDKKEAVLVTRMVPNHPFIKRLLFLLNWKRQIHEDAIGAASIVDSVAAERRAQAEEALLAAERARMAVEGEVTRKAAVRPAQALLAAIPVGRYAIDAADGSHLTFWELDKPTTGRWAGFVFLKIVAGPNVGRFSTIRPDGLATPAAISVLERIAKDPLAAGKRYADEVGCCARCAQTLTNELSRTRGYGETCWAKTNAEIGVGVR